MPNVPFDLTMENVLKFEREWWKYAGVKEQAIKDHFDCVVTDYYKKLDAIIDTEEAMLYDGILVKRLRRLRLYRQRQRAERLRGSHDA